MWSRIDMFGSSVLPFGSRKTPAHVLARTTRSFRHLFIGVRFRDLVLSSTLDAVNTILLLAVLDAAWFVRYVYSTDHELFFC